MKKARELQIECGYAKWERFHGVLLRADNIIRNGFRDGSITKCEKMSCLGSGAIRRIIDYLVDEGAENLIKELCLSYKINGSYCIRNEAATLSLLKKYCRYKGFSYEFQYKINNFVYDFRCNKILIEFDEPHHNESRQKLVDLKKDEFAILNGFRISRVTLATDIIDLIIEIERFGSYQD